MSLKSRIAKVEQAYSVEMCKEIAARNRGNRMAELEAQAAQRRLSQELAALREEEARA